MILMIPNKGMARTIPGMVLAIPLLAIVKIICDHIPSLKPYGYLIGIDRKKKNTLLKRKK